MGNVIAESLAIIGAVLPPTLVGAEQVALLRKAAGALVPIPDLRVGLECRLGAGAEQVDLQQGIYAGGLEDAMLARHAAGMASSADGPAGPVWDRVAAFGAAWSDRASCLHDVIHQVWLEFDLHEAAPRSLIPSLFVGLRERPADAAKDAALMAVEILRGGPLPPTVARGLLRCFDACAGDAWVSHVGLMLSRGEDAVRVNIARLPAERVVPFLERVGWPGPLDRLTTLVPTLYSVVQMITVCLDVGAEISPRIGLECYLAGTPTKDPGWSVFLDDLVGQGVCTVEKRDALTTWQGYIYPGSAPAPWPEALVIESLRQSRDRFELLARKINHVKLTMESSGALAAKAYIGFVRAWLEPAPGPRQVSLPIERKRRRPAARRRTAGAAVDQLDAAIEDATDFLLYARHLSGWWLDFPAVGGGSDEWVTAYAAATLASLPAPRAREAADHAWSLLCERRRDSGAWAFNLSLPEDWDSTSWGIRLAAILGAVGSERAERARRCLQTHLLPDGGLASYQEKTSQLDGASAPKLRDGFTGGWCRTAHACVTAPAAALVDGRMLDFLRCRQRDDGSWKGYWWVDDGYTTGLAAEALASTAAEADRARVLAAARWAEDRIGPDGSASAPRGSGSAFPTAWCVRILALRDVEDGPDGPIGRAVNWLIEHQREDGSWSPSAAMLVSPPDVTNPTSDDARSTIYLDDAAIFTTATALAALSAARSRLRRAPTTQIHNPPLQGLRSVRHP